MKKLNITKEQFEKSRYFKNKYGTLEYVSESGNVFKTNKGQVLKFVKESDTGWVVGEQEWNVGDRVDINVWQVQWELDDDDLASLPETGWKVKDAVRDDDYDDCDGFAYTIVHPGIEEEFVVSASALFKPSKPVRKPKGRALESSKKFGRKFVKESIDADPALICPYCSGDNCEVSIGTDDLNFTNLDRLQGETFNVECWCNDCNKPYNATVELTVKDVYPNEDADSLKYDI